MGYTSTKRAYGKLHWLGMQLKMQQVTGNKAMDLCHCLSLLHRVVEKDEQLHRDEALILIKLALEKSKELL
jgi:hypothetical protein